MGLEVNSSFRGLALAAAYHRIVYVGIDAEAQRAVLQLKVYSSIAARDGGQEPLVSESTTLEAAEFDAFHLACDSMNPFAAAYSVLRQRALYGGAQDVVHNPPSNTEPTPVRVPPIPPATPPASPPTPGILRRIRNWFTG